MQIALRPDPRRYEAYEKGGKTYYRDRYLGFHYGPEVIAQMAQKMAGTPVHYLAPSVENSEAYAAIRCEAVRHEISTGEYIAPEEDADEHQSLSPNARRAMTFISVDICGSTKLRAKMPVEFDQAFTILIKELGTVVGQFHGTMFKLTGDGFLAYIDHPSFNSACDQTVDMCLTFLVVLRDSINPALKESGLPELSIRVGAYFGDATIRSLSIPKTGFSTTDIASDALNRAAKVQGSCNPNELRVGRNLYELLHVQWLERTVQVPLNSDALGQDEYPVYRVI